MHKPWRSPSMTMPKNILKKMRNISDAANASTTMPRNVLTPKTYQEEKIRGCCDGHSTTNLKWWKLLKAEINLTLSGSLNKTNDGFFNQLRYIREILISWSELIKTIRHCEGGYRADVLSVSPSLEKIGSKHQLHNLFMVANFHYQLNRSKFSANTSHWNRATDF